MTSITSKLEQAMRRTEQFLNKSGGDKTKINYYSLRNGDNLFRVLPGGDTEDTAYPFREYKQHAFNLSDGFSGITCNIDPEKTDNPVCPICELAKKLYQESLDCSKTDPVLSEELKEKSKKLLPSDTICANVVDGNETDLENNIKVWQFSRTTFNKLLTLYKDPDYGDISNIEKGVDLTIEKTGTKRETKLGSIIPKRHNSIVIPEDWAKKVTKLSEFKNPVPHVLEWFASVLPEVEYDVEQIAKTDIPWSTKDKTDAGAKEEEAPKVATPAPAPKVEQPVATPAPAVVEQAVAEEAVDVGTPIAEAPKVSPQQLTMNAIQEKINALKKSK